jgi:hypothetical protein
MNKKGARALSLALLMILVSIGIVLASTLPYDQREPEAFRGIAWGTPVEEVQGLEFSKEGTATLRDLYSRTNKAAAPLVAVYTRPADEMRIGEASLSKIYYYFYDGAFYGVTAYFAGKDNYNKLLAACIKKFGEPTETEENGVAWRGEVAGISLSRSGVFSMDSEDLKEKMEEPPGF